MHEPTVNAIFESDRYEQIGNRRVSGEAYIERYVAQSQALQSDLTSKISAIAASGEDVIIWGAGSLTMHLLSDPAFSPLNIVAFVDANKNYWGKSLRGVPVCSPSRLKDFRGTILVVSYAYEGEICSQIRSTYNLRNRVVPLFGLTGGNRQAAG